MNRNSKLIAVLVCLLFVAAALVGCGGGAETQNHNPQPDVGDTGIETEADVPDVQPEAEPDVKEAGNDAGPEADAEVEADVPDVQPEAEPDADAQPDVDCEYTVCDPCSSEGLLCGDLICWDGLWIMNSDSGISHAGCPQIDAGPEADAEVEADVPDVQPEAEPDADAQPDVDADSGQAQETGTFDAPPPPPEICDNNADDDGDGFKDCADPDCYQAINCKAEVCNGLDDNGDGFVDNGPGMECAGLDGNSQSCTFMCGSTPLSGIQTCNTVTCKWNACAKVAITESNCSDGLDNDCDGQIDCEDMDCKINFIGCKSEICNNGLDDNGDGKADCDDPQCVNHISCVCEPPQVGWDCLYAGAYHPCDPAFRCDCYFKWNYASAPGAFVCQIEEVCNGLDDNGNGAVDETFACIYNTTTQCVTACGSIGSQYCNFNCQLQTCQPPLENCSDGMDNDCDGQIDCEDMDCKINFIGCKPEICDNNADDDGDGFKDCTDPDCWGTTACPHDFGTCGQVQLTGDALNCSTWTTEKVPKHVHSGCSLSANDHWIVTADYDRMTVMRLVSGSWTTVPLPIAGKPEGSKIFCVPGGQVFLVYNEHQETAPQGRIVLAKWTESEFERLNTPTAEGYNSTTAWAFDHSNIWIFGARWSGEKNTVVFKWDGTALTKTPYLEADDRVFYVTGFYATSMANVYASGYDWHQQTAERTAVLAHWDGVSWAKVGLPAFTGSFESIAGTSACDVMVGGYYFDANQDAQAVSFQRNGSNWVSSTYPGYKSIGTIVKMSEHKFVLGGHYHQGVDRWAVIGVSNGDSSMTWTFPHGDYKYHLASWRVPGSSTVMVAGEGNEGYISSASCQ